jgi:ribosomal protein S18 acetylase RimI-like enzyme
VAPFAAEHDVGMELKWMGTGDVSAVVAASSLFDNAARSGWARKFLQQSNHHLCVAYEGSVAAGFVSGVEMTHPDKGTEMFLYELGVEEAFRGRGIGRNLVAALAERAAEHGCYGMWVLTDRDNTAAMATYRAAGAEDDSTQVMLSWRFDADAEH